MENGKKPNKFKNFMNGYALSIERGNEEGKSTFSLTITNQAAMLACLPILVVPPVVLYGINPAIESILKFIGI